MKHLRSTLFLCGIFILLSFSCKEEAIPPPCGCGSEAIEYYENVVGTIMRFDALYIELQVSDGTIGVEPCEGLGDEFRTEGLKVIISGELKRICPIGTSNSKVTAPHPLKLTHIEILKSN